MKLSVLSVGPRQRASPLQTIAAGFEERLATYVSHSTHTFDTVEKVFALAEARGRTSPQLVLLDSRGQRFSSEELAGWIGRQRDAGAQHLIFAVGPADGWSNAARARADLLLSFGPMTFPHELARVMLAEQLYRAFTILAGHPYHSGH